MLRYCPECNCATHQKIVFQPYHQLFVFECKRCSAKEVYCNAYEGTSYSHNVGWANAANNYYEGRCFP